MSNDARWMEVSLTIDGELAEAVAEVLSRFAPEGVVIETRLKDWALEVEPIPEKYVRVCAYLPIDHRLEETKKQISHAFWHLGFIKPLPKIEYQPVKNANWAEAWKEHFQPIEVGKSLMIVPAWMDLAVPKRKGIKINPGMAFGTGTHPSTQLCLEIMEDWFLDLGISNNSKGVFKQGECQSVTSEATLKKGVNVIDVGCGSGILSIAAIKLGAVHALSIDIDPEAIASARENAELNGVSEKIQFHCGSMDELLREKGIILKAPLVLVNILAPVIINLLEQGLGKLMSEKGVMILSGILTEQALDLLAVIEINGLKIVSQRQKGDWVALQVAH